MEYFATYVAVFPQNVSLYSQQIAANGGQHQTGYDDTVIKQLNKKSALLQYGIKLQCYLNDTGYTVDG